jgi:hypothetical protein
MVSRLIMAFWILAPYIRVRGDALNGHRPTCRYRPLIRGLQLTAYTVCVLVIMSSQPESKTTGAINTVVQCAGIGKC